MGAAKVAPLPHVPSAAEAAGWSEPTRARLLVTALPAGLIIKGAAELMPRFAAKVLQLPPFAGCRRAAVHTTAPSVARAGRSCARVCVAALVLQRWSLGDAQPPEREALRAALQRLQVEPAERLRTCTELIDSNSGELVERTAGLVDRCAHLAGAESPLACGGEGAAADTPSAALTLHLTPRVTPRTFAVEMVKLATCLERLHAAADGIGLECALVQSRAVVGMGRAGRRAASACARFAATDSGRVVVAEL